MPELSQDHAVESKSTPAGCLRYHSALGVHPLTVCEGANRFSRVDFESTKAVRHARHLPLQLLVQSRRLVPVGRNRRC